MAGGLLGTWGKARLRGEHWGGGQVLRAPAPCGVLSLVRLPPIPEGSEDISAGLETSLVSKGASPQPRLHAVATEDVAAGKLQRH